MTEKNIFDKIIDTERNTHKTWILYQCPLMKEAGSHVDVLFSLDGSVL